MDRFPIGNIRPNKKEKGLGGKIITRDTLHFDLNMCSIKFIVNKYHHQIFIPDLGQTKEWMNPQIQKHLFFYKFKTG